jgi:hypothetical protein
MKIMQNLSMIIGAIDNAKANGYSRVEISFHNHRKIWAWKSKDYMGASCDVLV